MRQGDFWKFLSGETISVFGSAFTSFALPLLVYQITHSPINLAFDAAAGSLPYLFFGLIGGAFADRVNRKRLMMSMDILNALTISTIPLLFLLHTLPVWWIYMVSFLMTTWTILFQAANAAAPPSLVPQDKLIEANSRLMTAFVAASLLGSPLAGIVFGIMPVPNALLFDAASYIISFIALLSIRTSFNTPYGSVESEQTQVQPQKQTLRQDIIEGLRYIWQQPVIRLIVLFLVSINFINGVVFAELIFFAKTQLHASNFQYGLLVAAGSIGIIFSSLAAKWIRQRLAFGPIAIYALGLASIAFTLFALTSTPWLALPLWLVRAGLFALVDVNIISLRQTIVPNRLLGRVVTTSRVLYNLVSLVGTLLGGYLVAVTNATLVFVIVGIGTLLLCIGFLFTPLGTMHQNIQAQTSTT